MKHVVILFGVLAMFVMLAPLPANAQQNGNNPQIVSFSVDRDSVTPHEAESGQSVVELSWEIRGTRQGQSVDIEALVLDTWVIWVTRNIDDNTSGTQQVVVPHTLDYTPPTFRLVIRNRGGQIVAEERLSLQYEADSNAPQIVDFSILQDGVNLLDLTNETAILDVVWEVQYRPVGSNLRFLQVMDTETDELLSAELPREKDWVRSKGEGLLSPVFIQDAETLTFRMELYQPDTDEVYLSMDATIDIVETLVQPTSTATANDTGSTTQSSSISGAPTAIPTEVYVETTPIPTSTSAYTDTNCQPFFFVDPAQEYVFSGGGILNWEPFDLCATSAITTTNAIAQQFEGGWMLYREDISMIYVFSFNAIAVGYPSTYYNPDADVTYPSQPTEAHQQEPADVFAQLYVEHYDLTQYLGWAISDPIAYVLTSQSTTDDIFSWHGATVMTASNGGRFIMTHAEYASTPPVWAYINATN